MSSNFILFVSALNLWYCERTEKQRILLASSVGFAFFVSLDFVSGYQSFSNTNGFIQNRMKLHSMNQFVSGSRTKSKQTTAISLSQSSTKSSTFNASILLRNQLSFKDWLTQYFYQTRLNLYTNVFCRYIDVYYINYSRRNIPSLNILGQFLAESPSFYTMIDPPKLQRHEYVLKKLAVANRQNIVFFSDVNACIPYFDSTQILKFIEICCEITDNHECKVLFWRLQCEKSGYFEMGDCRMNIEGFISMMLVWGALKVHVLCHAYGSKIILRNRRKPKKLNHEMTKINEDFKTAETGMIALNHVAKWVGFVFWDGISEQEVTEILCVNATNMVWKHGAILQNEVLQNLKIVNFMNLARKKLMRLFTQNALHAMYDFEGAFLCLVCHGIDHYAMNTLKYFHLRTNEEMGIPDLIRFVTIFGPENKPILRESRLKYLAKSKMLSEFAIYLDSIDHQLANCVNLINSG